MLHPYQSLRPCTSAIVTHNAPPDNAPSPLLIATAPPLQCAMSSPALPTRRVLHFQCSSLPNAPSLRTLRPIIALCTAPATPPPCSPAPPPMRVTCSPLLVATFARVVRATPYSANALRSSASKHASAWRRASRCLWRKRSWWVVAATALYRLEPLAQQMLEVPLLGRIERTL